MANNCYKSNPLPVLATLTAKGAIESTWNKAGPSAVSGEACNTTEQMACPECDESIYKPERTNKNDMIVDLV